jgi:hypothetical protein
MAIEDIDYARAAAVQGDSEKPVTVAELAEAAGVELVTGDENTDSADDSNEAPAPARRGRPPRTTQPSTES